MESFRSHSPLYPSRFILPATISLPDDQCPVCHNILDSPEQLLCGKMAWGECIIMQGKKLNNNCQCCVGEHSNFPRVFRHHQVLYSLCLEAFLFSASSQTAHKHRKQLQQSTKF